MTLAPLHERTVLLAYPFRPFFLLTGLYGTVVILAWLAVLFGALPLSPQLSPLQWHAHEMLFGLIPAAIAGFLLTAMCNWTGATPLRGAGLLALVALWLAGRVALWSAAWLPGWLVIAVDLAFLPLLAVYAARVLLLHSHRSSLLLVAMIGLLSVANGLMLLEMFGGIPGLARYGELLGLNLITLVMVVMAGRITPAFTGNWLRARGLPHREVARSDGFDRWVLGITALMIPADLMLGMPVLSGLAALAAAILNAIRLFRWAGWQTLSEPLLWILHLGYAWIVLALLLKGLTPVVPGLHASAWIHALGTGAMGTLLLGVMTRVSLGHTGRPLRLPRLGLGIYIAVLLAGVIRVLGALGGIDTRPALMLAGLAWIAAFGLFLSLYWPILSRRRADGRPG